jgi:SPP1 gp7 family putative phage head morphogenesis protein
MLEAITALSQHYEFDVRELAKITGLPVVAIKAAAGFDPEPDDTQKKKSKVSGFLHLYPHASSGKFKGSAGLVYAASWDRENRNLAERMWQDKNPAEPDREVILKTYDRLNKAAGLGYGKNYHDDATARKMRQNLIEFAATKTHVLQKELQSIGKTAGDRTAYEEKAQKYLNLQNGTYLDVQASWSARSAQSARQWQEFQRDRDIYPNLKFRTMNDRDVRPAHAALEGLVIAVDDPALDQYMPPLDPRCRCWLEQTRQSVSDSVPDYHPNPQWTGNTGKTGIIFNDSNSYNQKVESPEIRNEIRTQAERTKEYAPYGKVIKAGANNVYVNDFADPSDLEQNIIAAKKIAGELGKDVYIRHHIDGGIIPGQKNPELGIGKPDSMGDLKTYMGKGKFNNFISDRIKSANEQGSQYAVLDVSLQKNLSDINRWIKGSLHNRNSGIKRIILINGDRVAELTRKQVERGNFSGLERLKEK